MKMVYCDCKMEVYWQGDEDNPLCFTECEQMKPIPFR